MPNKPKKEKVSRRLHALVVFSVWVKLSVFVALRDLVCLANVAR